MSLNWNEIDLIIEELKLPGAFVQKVRQPNFHSLLLDIYKPAAGRFPLLIELSPQNCRFHRLSHGIPFKKTAKLQRFAQLLRSRIQGGRITECLQLDGDRIIRITVQKAEVLTGLYIRLWSNAANIIAVDADEHILDAFYRRPNRHEVSGEQFTHEQPRKPVRAFPVRASFFEQEEPTVSFNEFIELLYETETTDRLASRLKEEAQSVLESEVTTLGHTISIKKRELLTLESYEQKKHYGDLLSAYRHLITPHAHWVTLEDYADDGHPVTIELDEKKSPSENIEHYYQSYHKAKGACERLIEEIDHAEAQLSQVLKEQQLLQHSTVSVEKQISHAQAILARGRHRHQVQKQERHVAVGLQFISGQYTILVGRTAKENDELLRHWTRGNDYWMHTRDYPGGYVFIKYIPGKSVPLETLLDAGNLALYYSKGRNSGKADLYYTQVKYLRRAKEGKLGTVLPTNEKNLAIELDQSRIDALFTGVPHA